MQGERVPLLDLVDIVGGGTPSRSEPRYWGGDIPWATVKDLDEKFISSTAENITRDGLENSSATLVRAGTIVLATRIAPGRVALANIDVAINQDLKGLITGDRIDPGYLLWFMRSVAPQLASRSSGSTVQGVTLETLARTRVPLPDLQEQRHIAALLNLADNVRLKRRQSLQLLDALLRSAYASLVGANNPRYEDWLQVPISDLSERRDGAMRTGPFGSALRHGEFNEQGEVAIIGIDNVVENEFRWTQPRFITLERYQKHFQRYTVRAGDVLVTIMGTTGKSAVVPDDIPLAISTKHLAVISVDRDRVHPEYLSHAIRLDQRLLAQIRSANRGAIMSGLNLGIVRRLKVRLPPMPTQLAFVRVVEQTRSLRSRFMDALDSHGRISQSLADRMFADSTMRSASSRHGEG